MCIGFEVVVVVSDDYSVCFQVGVVWVVGVFDVVEQVFFGQQVFDESEIGFLVLCCQIVFGVD